MSLKTLVGPSADPVTINELRQYLRIGTHEEDGILAILLKAAVERIEAKTFRAIMHQKLRQSFGRREIVNAILGARKSDGRILLRPDRLGVSSIDAVRVLNADGDFVTAPENFAKLSDDWFEISGDILGLEVDYFAGLNSSGEVLNHTKILVMEEALRLFNSRDNEKREEQNIAGARL